MTNPKVIAVANQLKLILDAQAGLDAAVRELLQSGDLRTAPQDLSEQMGKSLHATIGTIIERAAATEQTLHRLDAAMNYLQLEPSMGKGEWRAIANEDVNLRVSVKAIHSIRSSHGLSLYEARYTVEAYQVGLFE